MRGVLPWCGPLQIQFLIIHSPHRLQRRYRTPHHPPPLVASASRPPPSMGSPRKGEVKNRSKEMEAKEKGETAPAVEMSSSSLPPLRPPEKPLPGDCCGSGCVRCVWDIYYEELDAYNKALSAQSQTKGQ